ncbi:MULTISPECIES: ATP-grasp fold amidoligase family protein [Butyricimonas]|uniref:ATP-grasp fold amidoligase family protein n=1 Tax=Butyricimonas TaxID=574697 RepID=UPI000B37B645|nr:MULTISPECIES: ATP-grasp fold amidoligase family protein [Butyricimonas]OUN62768.1 hypothetical protein B5G13_19070 [Butyricimonas sp. An62]
MKMIDSIRKFYRYNVFTYYLCYPLRSLYNIFFFYLIPDKIALQVKFRKRHGYKLDFNNLNTFSEKLQWLKLYNRKPWYSDCVDKFKVREYVTQKLGTDKYLIPLFFETTHWKDIKPENMPNEPFVIKCNHDNNSYKIIYDKTKEDWKALRLFYRRRLSARSFFWANREWPYKNVKPRVIVEGLLSSTGNEYKLQEYKFHCFNGQIKVINFNEKDVDGKMWYRYLNKNYEVIDEKYSMGSTYELKKNFTPPLVAKEMSELALKIAADFEYNIRVDIYHVDGKLYVGELTFFDGAGWDKITPYEWNLELGSYLHLPVDKN